jgi:hypothetical protein
MNTPREEKMLWEREEKSTYRLVPDPIGGHPDSTMQRIGTSETTPHKKPKPKLGFGGAKRV